VSTAARAAHDGVVDAAGTRPIGESVALEARGLVKRYRRDRGPALDGIDVSIPSGSVTALVGPNGAGKSTLIRCFLGFERPTRGFVTVDGIDPRRDRQAALARIGYVGQETGLYRDLSADDHLALAAALRRGFDRSGAARRLDALGIPLRVRTSELSGGQQAQIALALALGTQAPVLLLDEPISRLDPLARRDFMAVVGDAARRHGTTVLLASHIVGDLDSVCDSLIVLAPARVMLHGSIATARTSHAIVPAGTSVASDELVATFNGPSGRLVSLVRRPGSIEASLDEVVLGYLAAARGSRDAKA
jgi:ABC-2 type transport system ATP-binding protein